MKLPEGATLLATICNTVGVASPFALWLSDGKQQYVVDLSDHMQDSGGLTGIAYHDDRIYVAVQSDRPRILVLDMGLCVVDVIQSGDFNDLHSLHIAGDALFIVSTRNGQLLKRDLATGNTSVIADFDPAAWVSGVHCRGDDIWLCCHEVWRLDPTARGGGVFSIGRGRKVLDGLLRPHSLIGYCNEFVVLDSGNARVVYFDHDGIKQACQLHGFPRGAAIAGEATLLVAGGPHRTISRKNPAGVAGKNFREVAHERLKLFTVEQGKHTATFLPELPGFEIYDLLLLPANVALRPVDGRVVRVEQGMFARLYYVTLVDALFRLSGAPDKLQ
jgi:hypothetical protein